jgi:hypothetical protein
VVLVRLMLNLGGVLSDTAFVKSQKGSGDKNWMYCDDSKITQHTVNDVVVSPVEPNSNEENAQRSTQCRHDQIRRIYCSTNECRHRMIWKRLRSGDTVKSCIQGPG